MLRSQQTVRQSQLLETRIQASLQTIADWRRQNQDESMNDVIGAQLDISNDDDGRTSPTASCGSNTLITTDTCIIKVVKLGPNGHDEELSLQDMPLEELASRHRVEKDTDNFGGRKVISDKEILVGMTSMKKEFKSIENDVSRNVAPVSNKNARVDNVPMEILTVSKHRSNAAHTSRPLTVPPSPHEDRFNKSLKSRGDYIRSMKLYDAELLDSMRNGTAKPASFGRRRRGNGDDTTPPVRVLISNRDEEINDASDSIVRSKIVPGNVEMPNNAAREKPQLRRLATIDDNTRTSRRPHPPLERRVSELLLLEQKDSQGKTILFPRAPQRRSNSGRREALLAASSDKHQRSSQRSFWSNLSLRRQRNENNSSTSRMSWRPSSLRFSRSKRLKENKKSATSSKSAGRFAKKASWDDVPDVSEFPPSFFGNPVVVSTTRKHSDLL